MENEKRYQVFVSSTYTDLRSERTAVISTLLNLDAFPAGMELFPAADDDAWTLIEDIIKDSAYYLLIIGGKYGSVDPDLDISYTEREFDLAVKLKKPVMAFLHGAHGKLLVEQSEISEDRRAKLELFREKVEKTKHVNYWSTSDELAGKLALTWNKFRKRYPATGWIRADGASSQENLAALAKAQAEIESLKSQLQATRTEAPAGTEELAQGDEQFEVPVFASGSYLQNGYRKETGSWVNLVFSWNRVFGYLGLSMMQDADEPTLKESLAAFAETEYYEELKSAFDERIGSLKKMSNSSVSNESFSDAQINDEDFQTILLQLDALGLIQHSRRPRSVRDTSNYWTLTPYGHTRLIQLRALQRGTGSIAHNEHEK
jgi:hypothetical protein